MRMENGNPVGPQSERLAYQDFKANQSKKRKKQNIMMFLSIFAVLLLIFLGVAKLMSPDIDISLGDDSSRNSQAEDEYRRGVDSRLKMLQQDDEMNLTEHDETEETVEEDGVVKVPHNLTDRSFKPLEDEEPVMTAKSDETTTPAETKNNNSGNPISPDSAPTSLKNNAAHNVAVAPTTMQTTKTYKVYVGMYSTQSQAEVARGILQEAGMGLTPHIKQAAGGYTLQVGAFSSKESATNLSNKLLINNYPARVVSD
ncbi:SPOR domain-containing protein [bacterium]|nr:SPOR domain-containing protein [bacterium]